MSYGPNDPRRLGPTTHGMCYTPEYHCWKAMKSRCSNPNIPAYKNYGGRGISVCAWWLHSFENFYADMGPRPDSHSIERIDNDGNYEPSNCIWADRATQSKNQHHPVNETTCSNGHPLDITITARPNRGAGTERVCRTCNKNRQARYRVKRRAA